MKYSIEVTAVDEDGEEACLGIVLVSAKSRKQAEAVATEALWDPRLSAASCSAVTEVLASFKEHPREREAARKYQDKARSWWTLSISDYGSFSVYACEEEAEERLRDKMEWEGGEGDKRRATAAEILKAKQDITWRKEQGYGLELAEIEALSA